MNIEGGCYCGEIRYLSKGEAQASIQCHCRECQYITGGNPSHSYKKLLSCVGLL